MYGLLIVDDEDIIRNGLANTINWISMGFHVVGTACNGGKALDMLDEFKPDVILADIRMPGLSGIELAKKIGEDYPEIYVIILTGFDQFEYAKEAIDYNVFSYLLKPYNKDNLHDVFSRLKKIIDKKRDVESISNIANQTLLNRELKHYVDQFGELYTAEAIHEHFLTIIKESAESTGGNRIDTSNSIIKRALSIIQFRYMEDLSLDIITEELQVSSSYLSRLFKKETGVNFKDYLKNYRVNLAKYKLRNTTMKIYEIAEAVGYRDQAYFSDLFKKTVGCSPNKYKNRKHGVDS